MIVLFFFFFPLVKLQNSRVEVGKTVLCRGKKTRELETLVSHIVIDFLKCLLFCILGVCLFSTVLGNTVDSPEIVVELLLRVSIKSEFRKSQEVPNDCVR